MATSKELLTNLADELRTLTNTTDKMGLSVMAGHVSDANNEIDTSDALVEQIISAMSGKSVPERATVHNIYTGTAEPTADIGSDGDIYIMRSEA